MSLHDIQEGIGNTGKFGEGFVGLGLMALVGGAILVFMGVFSTWPVKNTGTAVYEDSFVAGALFLVMGIGFLVFAAMVILSGWARQHPGYDEHGLHPTEAQLED